VVQVQGSQFFDRQHVGLDGIEGDDDFGVRVALDSFPETS
jgi:hypothetical protein